MSTLPPDDDSPYGDEVSGYDPYGAAPSSGSGFDDEPAINERWSLGGALNYGWSKYTQDIGHMLLAGLAILIALIATETVSNLFDRAITTPSHLVEDATGSHYEGGSPFVWWWTADNIGAILVTFLVQLVLAGFIKGALQVTEGQRFDLRMAFREVHWGDIALLSLITTAIVFVGTLMCIVPGLIAMLFLMFALYFQLDRGLSPWDSIKASARLVRDNLGKALSWFVIGGLVALVGICFCGIGAIVTFPIALLGTAWTYKKLRREPVA
jgi:uncharacterized membrane protein